MLRVLTNLTRFKTNFCYFFFLILINATNAQSRLVEDFNFGWNFHLTSSLSEAPLITPSDYQWEGIRLPHDWSAQSSFTTEETGASTGFLPGGVGWYRKEFVLPTTSSDKLTFIEFDGVYCNAEVWINGIYLGKRPYGYSSFSYDLSSHLKFSNEKNVLVVKVDHSNYLDSRWYTGSGIYRNVRLVTKSRTYIPQWGVKVSTPSVSREKASVHVKLLLNNVNVKPNNCSIQASVYGPNGKRLEKQEQKVKVAETTSLNFDFSILSPRLWELDNPMLYKISFTVLHGKTVLDQYDQTFGIREAHFDADKGFFLNGKPMKIKGVNLHHEGGAVGAAVPVDVWKRRLTKLKEIGCNAIRTAHNPVAPEFLDLCDSMGFLVLGEFFDEWDRPKEKSLVKLGDNKAPDSVSRGYSEHFNEWAERDLKDCIRRDYNHPSITMWSIGNEIEWTFPEYSEAYEQVNGKQKPYKYTPDYDTLKINKALSALYPGNDTLVMIAEKLVRWVKDEDLTRPVSSGSVMPSISLASGYLKSLDVVGFNYRAYDYDAAHAYYPDLKIYGSENWGTYNEWKAARDRDFVAGIFTWTGIAYQGESGPFPHKGLNLSFFDFAGFKTPRGHFFETLWKDKPHVYIGTTPLSESEFTYDSISGFGIEYKTDWIRRWTWYDIYDKWQYDEGEEILVQAYSNCEKNELFLNGKSLGVKLLSDFSEDRIVKWIVPFKAGDLKIVGYRNGIIASSYTLKTASKPYAIVAKVDREQLRANSYDVAHIEVALIDESGNHVSHDERDVRFEISGAEMNIIGVDNGSAYNVQDYISDHVITSNGRALLMLQAKDKKGSVTVVVRSGDLKEDRIEILLK